MQCSFEPELDYDQGLDSARWSEAETMQDCQPCSKPIPRLGCLAYAQKDISQMTRGNVG